MKKQSKHQLVKKLKREERHKEWLKQNLPNSNQQKKSQKQIIRLYTNLRTNHW